MNSNLNNLVHPHCKREWMCQAVLSSWEIISKKKKKCCKFTLEEKAQILKLMKEIIIIKKKNMTKRVLQYASPDVNDSRRKQEKKQKNQLPLKQIFGWAACDHRERRWILHLMNTWFQDAQSRNILVNDYPALLWKCVGEWGCCG